MTGRFDGKRVVVTGASRGLGATLAARFAAERALVAVGYRARAEEAAAVVRGIEAAGGAARSVAFDVRDAAQVTAAFAALQKEGPIDVLVNNAGVARDGLFAVSDEAAWADVLETNLLGVMRCCRAVVPAMWRARRGAIVVVASVSAAIASPGQSSYAASKAGLVGLTRTLAAELAPRGIRVNAVVPGLIDAGMTRALAAAAVTEKMPRIPAGRLGSPEEVADAVLFLASESASYLHGQALFVDGGLSL